MIMLFQLCVHYNGELIFEQTSSDYSVLIETLNHVISNMYYLIDEYNFGSVFDSTMFKYVIKEVTPV